MLRDRHHSLHDQVARTPSWSRPSGTWPGWQSALPPSDTTKPFSRALHDLPTTNCISPGRPCMVSNSPGTHGRVEYCHGIMYPKRHSQELILALMTNKGRLLYVSWVHGNLVVSLRLEMTLDLPTLCSTSSTRGM